MILSLADGLGLRNLGHQSEWIPVPDGMYDLAVWRLPLMGCPALLAWCHRSSVSNCSLDMPHLPYYPVSRSVEADVSTFRHSLTGRAE